MSPLRLFNVFSIVVFASLFARAAEPMNSYPTDFPWENYSVFQWQETRGHLGLGVNSFGVGYARDTAPAITFRYRLSPEPWPKSDEGQWHAGPIPLNLWLEAGSIIPHTGTALRTETENFKVTTIDDASVRLKWQTHAALATEIPIGTQRWFVPDVALGIAAASLEDRYDTRTPWFGGLESYEGSQDQTAFSPYFRLGIHLFSDHAVSFRLTAAHVNYPDRFTRNFIYQFNPQSSHQQSFDLSLSGWQITPMIEIKLLWPSAVHVPLIPQALPPWLLPSYTTEPISPWVASPEVAKDPHYNRPGQASVGNVMFQYRNHWVDKVEIIGEFNDWVPERMTKDRSGIWVLVKDLPPGKFRYNYLIDGLKEIRDPWNKNVDPDSRSRGSSIVIVK